MGLFDFFKKKPTEQTQIEQQQDGVFEVDGLEVETVVVEDEILLDDLETEDEAEESEELSVADAAEDVTEDDAASQIGEAAQTTEGYAAEEAEAEEVPAEDTEPVEESAEEAPTGEVKEEAAEEVAAEETEQPAEEKPEKMGFFAKLKAGLDKTRKNILGGVDGVLGAFTKIDEDLFEELEEALIMADMGVQTTMHIVENLRKRVKREHATDPALIKGMLIDEITAILEEDAADAEELPSPSVILVIGVNGVGKTTTIGKLAHNYKEEGQSVLLAAADTFRAAAIDQLEIWGERSGIEVIKHEENSDPAAVVYDAVHAARGKKTDLLICDTAGRLHNKKNLMEELKKIARVIEREYPDAHKEVYLVLDATTGQNALQQAKLFREVADITGIILTKLDGTAKGGIVVAIKSELQIPVRYIGVGEGIADLQKFDASGFARALFEREAE